MTRKEQLYKEWLDLRYEIQSINGTAIPRTTPQSRTIAEWESFISSTIELLRRLKEHQRINEYWATEGQARKKELLDERQSLYNEIAEDWYCAAEAAVREMVQELIGKEFDTHFDGRKIEIGLVEKYEGDLPCFYFAHTWQVYYGYDYMLLNDFRFEMDYCSCGSFNPLEDTTLTKFVAGMSKFATSTGFLQKLRDELQYFSEEVRKRQERIRAIDDELKNPFNNK